MKLKTFSDIRNSLFTRLTVTSLVTGIFIVLSVWIVAALYFRVDRHEALVRHIAGYTSYIINDIGNPPDVEKAAAITSENNIYIEIQGNGFLWKSSETGYSPDKIRHQNMKNGAVYGMWKRSFVYIVQRGKYTYSMIFKPVMFSGRGESYLSFVFLMLLAVIVAVSYFVIRRMLLPLKALGEGVQQNISGNLNYRIPGMKDDEIGRLADSFNLMTDRIQSMIESREQLLRDVSHELRSPLTRMKVALELYGDEKIREAVGGDINALETMITEILESERMHNISSGEIENTDLRALAADVVEELGASDVVKFDFPADEIVLKSGTGLVKIALRNIIQNAVKYADRENALVKVACIREPGLVKITITDNGSGVPDSEIGNIFEPFYMIDKSRSSAEGYGLGLHIAKKSVEKLGGSISFKNSAEGGAEVTIFVRSE